MQTRPLPARDRPRLRQQGSALLIVITIIVIGAATLLVSALTKASLRLDRDKVTTAALAQAKDALLGFAASHLSQPGNLPCPDVSNDGVGDMTGLNCNAYIGRLPWKDLSLPDLRDSSGECLWYALSPIFRNALPASGRTRTSSPLNSTTSGQLNIYDTSGTLLPAPSNPVIAVIFSPGQALPLQNRASGSPSVCGGNNNAANYLDSASGMNNSTGGGTATQFIAADKTSSFNDRLLNITADQFFLLINKRVVAEIRGLSQPPVSGLRQYYFNAANHVYPWAASTVSAGAPVASQASGLVPYALLSFAPTTSTWLTNNDWFALATYKVSANFQPGTTYSQQCGAGGAGCLTVNGYANSQAQISASGISAITCTVNAAVMNCPYP